MLIDTHCHIHDRSVYNFALSHQQLSRKLLQKYPNLPHLPADFLPEKIVARAHSNDIQKMICIGTSHEDSLVAQKFAMTHQADGIFWAYGIHPDEADNITDFVRHVDLANLPPVAIGEIGLDYRSGEGNRQRQLTLFEHMLQLANDENLPVILHVREAYDDFFAVINNFPALRGVVHSFSDSPKNLKKALNHNFYIGVNGLVTFAQEIPLPPLEKMLLETDAPFLTPSPFRGTINEPAHIKDVCAYISNINRKDEAQVAKVTTENAERLFKI